MKIPKIKLKKSRDRFECKQEQDGKIECRSYREHADGTRTELAGIDFQFDGECKAVATNMFENTPGELEKLEKKSINRLRERCKNRPVDYE